MIQTNLTFKATPHFRMLTDDQVVRISYASFEILEKVGFKVLHPEARKMLKSAGAIVNGESVKVPEFIVRGCLATAPRGWTLYDRHGNRALNVADRNSFYGTSTASPRTKDALTGKYH